MVADGRLLSATDALAMPTGTHLQCLYPVHADRIVGTAWKLVLTASGLAPATPGSLAVWSFWLDRPRLQGLGHAIAKRDARCDPQAASTNRFHFFDRLGRED